MMSATKRTRGSNETQDVGSPSGSLSRAFREVECLHNLERSTRSAKQKAKEVISAACQQVFVSCVFPPRPKSCL
jgi:hypothetical protein